MNSRRKFLVASTAALAGAVLPKALLAERLGGEVFTNASLGPYLQGTMTAANFKKLIGSSFTVFLENDQIAYLRLQTVTTPDTTSTAQSKPSAVIAVKRAVTNTVNTTTFHLHFTVSGQDFPQDTYLVDHGTMGRFALFIVPGAPQTCGSTFCMLTT